MGFKRGMIVGFGIGYVLGAKAGRQRYEEIRQAWGRVMGNPQVQQGLERGKDLAAASAQKSLHAVQEGAEKVTEKVKEKVGKDDGSSGTSTTPPASPTATGTGGPATP